MLQDKKPNNWKETHSAVERAFLVYLNKNTDSFILKGGTALYLCYGLTRFSEDIDLDGKNTGIKGKLEIGPYIEEFCKKNGFSANLKKDTDMVERWMIDYGSSDRKLKIESSYRTIDSPAIGASYVDGIKVYDIDRLTVMKCVAISDRIKIRDFYDICFIANKYWDKISSSSKAMIQNVFEYKNFEYAEFLINTQKDELIQAGDLADVFLNAYEKAGLSMATEDKKIADTLKKVDTHPVGFSKKTKQTTKHNKWDLDR